MRGGSAGGAVEKEPLFSLKRQHRDGMLSNRLWIVARLGIGAVLLGSCAQGTASGRGRAGRTDAWRRTGRDAAGTGSDEHAFLREWAPGHRLSLSGGVATDGKRGERPARQPESRGRAAWDDAEV